MVWKCPYTWDDTGYHRLHCLCCDTGILLYYLHSLPPFIAPAQVRFALSSSATFTWSDTITDSERFYNSILQFLEDLDEKIEVDALLVWWNQQVQFASHLYLDFLMLYW